MGGRGYVAALPGPADFGGRCLIGECELEAYLLNPTSSYLGLRKAGSYLFGTWRDGDGNLLRALRSIDGETSTRRSLLVSRPGSQLERDERADRELWNGSVATGLDGGSARFRGGTFEYVHEPESCAWADGDLLAVAGKSIGPALQWFNTWRGGACLTVTGTYRTSGTLLGRQVEGFVGHEIHYFPPGANWIKSPYGEGREFCWQHMANEYEDGTTVHGTFACGADGWGFAMLHDDQGEFHCSTDVRASATVRPNGVLETIRYEFDDQSWTWRLDPQGERPAIMPGALIGADGTCRRDGDDRAVRYSLGNSDWWLDGRAEAIIRRTGASR